MAAIPLRLNVLKRRDNVVDIVGYRFEKAIDRLGNRVREIRRDMRRDFRRRTLPALKALRLDMQRQTMPVLTGIRQDFRRQAMPALRFGIGNMAIGALRRMNRVQDRMQMRNTRRRKRMVRAIRNWMA